MHKWVQGRAEVGAAAHPHLPRVCYVACGQRVLRIDRTTGGVLQSASVDPVSTLEPLAQLWHGLTPWQLCVGPSSRTAASDSARQLSWSRTARARAVSKTTRA